MELTIQGTGAVAREPAYSEAIQAAKEILSSHGVTLEQVRQEWESPSSGVDAAWNEAENAVIRIMGSDRFSLGIE